MSWDYRVHKDSSGHHIIETYYDDNHKVKTYSGPMEVYGETLEELRADLSYMLTALDKPILTDLDLVGGNEG